ncbi:hypothetical protein [Gelidibacter maritimus]|uniref:Gingipain domain-containing protein n=1 Tax=Gelidibacter maritimus TaxID=2761487 RepID=A0A7W2M3I0_9FLAO|nr:hypothetical protein [Gelidibacter maritimus]MBA6152049.1 hypothetical protein [Gelidibacter maritimus]
MKKLFPLMFVMLTMILQAQHKATNYVIAASEAVKNDAEWLKVVDELQKLHPDAVVISYQDSLNQLLPSLRNLRPRYLAVIEKPKNINRDFVIEGNRMSRTIDDDRYDDYIWGVITGYSPEDALRTIRQSAEPFIIKSALSSITEVSSGEWFDKFAWIDDHVRGRWGEKTNPQDPVAIYKTDTLGDLLSIFHKKWEEIDPDLIITASHATQYNLEMPYSVGNLVAKNGQLYAKYKEPEAIVSTNKPRVFFPVGNCLIADMNNSDQSMAAAFLSSGGSTAMIGYVVSTWYGRNGWGALKYFLANPGKHTLAEAAFLNRQDMLTQEYRKDPRYLDVIPNFKTFGDAARNDIAKKMAELQPDNLTMDDIGFSFDRDVVVYYGDPAWNVRSKSILDSPGYHFKFENKGDNYTITLTTEDNFSIDKAKGKGFKEEHVKDIPLAYFLPQRIFNPGIFENKQHLDVAFDENFLLIYNQDIKPNEAYTIILTSKVE